MEETRRKTINYHRAEYFNSNPASITLGACIKEATDKLKTIPDRTISIWSGQVIRLASIRTDSKKGHLIHLTAETPGEAASVVPKVAASASQVDVSTIAPPSDAEFMDGDAFLYVCGNNIVICTTGMRIAGVEYFFKNFFAEAKTRKDANDFEIMNALDANKIALLERKGVKEIELKGTLFRATVDYGRRKNQAVGVIEKAAKHFKALFGSENDVTEDSLRVLITLKVDKRRKGMGIGHKRLEGLAKGIVENQQDSDEYVIVTNDGEKIEPKEILLRITSNIASKGKSVDREHAWTALKQYYKELESEGIFEQ